VQTLPAQASFVHGFLSSQSDAVVQTPLLPVLLLAELLLLVVVISPLPPAPPVLPAPLLDELDEAAALAPPLPGGVSAEEQLASRAAPRTSVAAPSCKDEFMRAGVT
jgi:hypothetical protein